MWFKWLFVPTLTSPRHFPVTNNKLSSPHFLLPSRPPLPSPISSSYPFTPFCRLIYFDLGHGISVAFWPLQHFWRRDSVDHNSMPLTRHHDSLIDDGTQDLFPAKGSTGQKPILQFQYADVSVPPTLTTTLHLMDDKYTRSHPIRRPPTVLAVPPHILRASRLTKRRSAESWVAGFTVRAPSIEHRHQ